MNTIQNYFGLRFKGQFLGVNAKVAKTHLKMKKFGTLGNCLNYLNKYVSADMMDETEVVKFKFSFEDGESVCGVFDAKATIASEKSTLTRDRKTDLMHLNYQREALTGDIEPIFAALAAEPEESFTADLIRNHRVKARVFGRKHHFASSLWHFMHEDAEASVALLKRFRNDAEGFRSYITEAINVAACEVEVDYAADVASAEKRASSLRINVLSCSPASMLSL